MSIVLIGDSALEQYSCHRFADAWRQAGRSCLVVGPTMTEDQPLPHRSCDLTLDPKELLGSTVLEHATAIGLFLRTPQTLKRLRRDTEPFAEAVASGLPQSSAAP